MQDLKNLSPEEKQKLLDEVNGEVVAETPVEGEVTKIETLAGEEKKTGKKIEMPTAEQLVSIVSANLIKNRKDINNMLWDMSKKQVIRTVMALLDIPQAQMPVYLKTEEEKIVFAIGQKALYNKFTIIQHSINQEIAKDRLKKQQEAKNNSTTNGDQTNETLKETSSETTEKQQ